MRKALLIVVAATAVSALACAGAAKLRVEGSSGPPLEEGTYTVFLYSTEQSEGLEGTQRVKGLIAILDLEGDGYEFHLRAPGFDYGTVRGLTGPEAVRSAQWFIGRQYSGKLSYMRIIADGKTVGYEIRPEKKQMLYRRLAINTDYLLTGGNTVEVVFGVGLPAGRVGPY